MPKKGIPSGPGSTSKPRFPMDVEFSRPEAQGVGALGPPESRSGAPMPEGTDRERDRRIAGRLHDEVQQLLFGIRLKCTVARNRTSDEARALAADLADIEAWAAEAITAVQELHSELRASAQFEERRRAR